MPAPAPGEALLRPSLSLVTATDHRIATGQGSFEGVLGRSFIGVVDAVEAEGRAASLVGKRVVAEAATFCGGCDRCRSGLRQHCEQRTLPGMDGRDGCLAEAVALPVHMLHVVPDSVDDDRAVFAPILAAAFASVHQLTIEGRPYITVLGDGPLGLLTVQLMSRLNASVRLVGRYSEKLALCEKWGVKHRHVDDVGRRADQDIVVDCTGTLNGFETALRMARPRGSILLRSLLPVGDRVAPAELLDPIVLNELVIHGSLSGPMTEALQLLERQDVDTLSIISRRMRLKQGTEILSAAGQPGDAAILVAP